jgi:hypothetical protein
MEDFVDYKEKYLKYKSKYFQLKQELDGGLLKTLQLASRVGKQTYKTISGKYDTELQEINAILNKTVYINEGNILTIYDYDSKEKENIDNQSIQLIYTNLELLDPELFLSKKNTSSESSVLPDLKVNKLPNVKKFLAAVKKVISNTTNFASIEKDTVMQNVYKNRICDLNRILEIHYMCKGTNGIFNYTIEKCFINNHLPSIQTLSSRQKTKLPNSNQYEQQYKQKYTSVNELYKLKYYKYKTKYLELEGGILAGMNKAASLVKKGVAASAKNIATNVKKGVIASAKNVATSVASSAKNITSSAKNIASTAKNIVLGPSINDIINIISKYEDIKTDFTKDITDNDFKYKLDQSKKKAEEDLKDIDVKTKADKVVLNQKISDIKKLESLISNKCKLKSADTTYTNDKCFESIIPIGGAF